MENNDLEFILSSLDESNFNQAQQNVEVMKETGLISTVHVRMIAYDDLV